MKIFLEKPWLWKILAKLTLDLGFCTEKIDFYRTISVDLIQPHFDYACPAWYPNLNSRLKSKLQILQNKYTCFCLNLDSKAHIALTKFEKINWLPMNDRFEQCISSMTFNHFSYLNPLYMNDVFKLAGQSTAATRTSLLKLSQPLRKTNHAQKSLSCVAPSVWNKLPNFLKTTDNSSVFIPICTHFVFIGSAKILLVCIFSTSNNKQFFTHSLFYLKFYYHKNT